MVLTHGAKAIEIEDMEARVSELEPRRGRREKTSCEIGRALVLVQHDFQDGGDRRRTRRLV